PYTPLFRSRKGYAGYEYDPTFEGAGRHLYHVRHRIYVADVGRWTRRDPIGYVEGMSLYEYVHGFALRATDPLGLFGQVGSPVCSGGNCGIPQAPAAPAPHVGPLVCVGTTCATPQEPTSSVPPACPDSAPTSPAPTQPGTTAPTKTRMQLWPECVAGCS